MPALQTAKYVQLGVSKHNKEHPEVSAPIVVLKPDEKFGGALKYQLAFEPITQPFLMVKDNHAHNFDQYLIFIGGDPTNLMDLGGEVELTLSLDGKKLEKHVITQTTTVFVPKGLYHCPLNFKRVDKPFLFINLYFANDYART
jgi:hypothetical protein